MPHSISAAKRVRQNRKRRLVNRAATSRIRTSMKKFRAMVDAGKVDEAKTAYSLMEKKLDQAAAKGVLHKNTASRYKSRLALLLNKAVKK